MNLLLFGSFLSATEAFEAKSLPLKPNAQSFAPQSIGQRSQKSTIERQGGATVQFPENWVEAKAKALRRTRERVLSSENQRRRAENELRQVRAQFEYLARMHSPRDIASQVYVRARGNTPGPALTRGETDRLPVGRGGIEHPRFLPATSLATADTV